MKIFYNFDDMYAPKKNTNTELINVSKSNTSKQEIINKSENLFELDKNIALFDYSAKATSNHVSKQNCSNIDCFEGALSQEVPDNCADYDNCLQYFNTMPIVNCIDNVPSASFLVIEP